MQSNQFDKKQASSFQLKVNTKTKNNEKDDPLKDLKKVLLMPVTAVTHQEMSAKKDDIRLRSNSEFPSTKKTSIGSPRSQHIGSRKTA